MWIDIYVDEFKARDEAAGYLATLKESSHDTIAAAEKVKVSNAFRLELESFENQYLKTTNVRLVEQVQSIHGSARRGIKRVNL